MLKFAGMAAIAAACTALGFCLSTELAKRIRSLWELERMTVMLKGEIEYAGTPLQEAFCALAHRMKPPFDSFLRRNVEAMAQHSGMTMGEIFRNSAERLKKEGALTENDIQQLSSMGARLGYLDRKMQLRTMELYLEEVARERKLAEEEYRQKAKVYRCLGILGGMFLILLLI